MSGYWWWLILTQITGNPLLAVILLFAGGWALDGFTLGILPSPLRAFRRWQRTGKLAREIEINPANRKSRFELADLLCGHHRYARALAVLKPNVAAGDDDAATMFLMGVAAYGSGHPEQAETFLAHALEQDPDYRMGAIFLEQGRGRLARQDWAGAKSALEEFCKRRRGTVQGKVMLAKACARQGDEARSRTLRREAWSDYASSPRFVQRQERWWAWRLQPWRPVLLVAGAAALAWGASQVVPRLTGGSGPLAGISRLGHARATAPGALLGSAGMNAAQQAQFRAALATPMHPGGGPIDSKRFVRLPADELLGTSQLRGRYDPTNSDPAQQQKMIPGDMLGRIWAHYGPPDPGQGMFGYVFRDTQTGAVFSAYSAEGGPGYGTRMFDLHTKQPISPEERNKAEIAVGAFDQMLDETKPVDCEWTLSSGDGMYRSGVRAGQPFAEDL